MDLIDLSKKVDIVLTKRKATDIKLQVGVTLDVSGSAKPMFRSGIIQRMLQRMYALAYKFDDNQVLDSWMFSNESFQLPPMEIDKFKSYTDDVVLKSTGIDMWGGTQYLPTITQILHFYNIAKTSSPKSSGFLSSIKKLFGGGESTDIPQPQSPQIPSYILFTTDGENSQGERVYIEQLLSQHQDAPIFWQFIGIDTDSSSTFPWLQSLANKYSNVGFLNANDIDLVPDEQLYNALLNEKMLKWHNAVQSSQKA